MNTQFYKIDEKKKILIPHRKYAGRDKDKIGFEYDERYLENLILSAPESIYPYKFIIIGEQIKTDFGPLDLLGLDDKGNILLIELKVGKTPRDIIAQVLEYSAFINKKCSIKNIISFANRNEEEKIKKFLIKHNLKQIRKEIVSIIVAGWIDESIAEVSKYLMKKFNFPMYFVEFAFYQNKSNEKFIEFSSNEKINVKPNLEDVLRTLNDKSKINLARKIIKIIINKCKNLNFEYNVVPKWHNRVDIYKNNVWIGRFEFAYIDKFSFQFKLKEKKNKIDKILKNYNIIDMTKLFFDNNNTIVSDILLEIPFKHKDLNLINFITNEVPILFNNL